MQQLRQKSPFFTFFDGFRTSHEYQKIEVIDYDLCKYLLDYKALEEFRGKSLNPNAPITRGTAQNPDIYFQGREAANPYFDKVADIVSDYMEQLGEKTGRKYRPFDYYGAKDADKVIIAMGSVCDTAQETIDYLNNRGEKVGLVKVRLYRPFSPTHFFQAIPSTVKKISCIRQNKGTWLSWRTAL